MILQLPFPEPVDETSTMLYIGNIYIIFLMFLVFMVLMAYSYKKLRNFMPMTLIMGISNMFGLIATFSYAVFPFPEFCISFILWQNVIWLIGAIELRDKRKKERE